MYYFAMLVLLPMAIIGVSLIAITYFLLSPLYNDIPHSLALGFRKCAFILTRGQSKGKTDFFFDMDLTVTDPKTLKSIVNWYINTRSFPNGSRHHSPAKQFVQVFIILMHGRMVLVRSNGITICKGICCEDWIDIIGRLSQWST